MAGVQLYTHQVEALQKLRDGCILYGTVGSGKSRTSLSYYYTQFGGKVNTKSYVRMHNPCDLYIITTARKRDDKEWEAELATFLMSTNTNLNLYANNVVIDSWNNIKKYVDVKNAFFIFDEQRVVGTGTWVKSFLKITRRNRWILLSATPGDQWSDYIPVFIANGFYRNKTDFNNNHVVFSPWTKFPMIQKYVNEGRLIQYRSRILVGMDFVRKTKPQHKDVICDYDRETYKMIVKDRWNPYKNAPIETANEFCLTLRRLVNSDISRQQEVMDIVMKHKKAIIFYNYDYELDILRNLFKGIYSCSEWNGHLHEKIMSGESWVYLVQYAAGNEGWNCITCDTMIFYSQNYSYKVMAQAAGRIDRLNTPYEDLYSYHLTSTSNIDRAIARTLNKKKKFNEKAFAPDFTKKENINETSTIQNKSNYYATCGNDRSNTTIRPYMDK